MGRRYIGKCKGCGIHSSVLVDDVTLNAARFFYGYSKTLPMPTTAFVVMQSGDYGVICRGCGRAVRARMVQGKRSEKHECNARCLESRGFQCECSCGGENHGASYSAC